MTIKKIAIASAIAAVTVPGVADAKKSDKAKKAPKTQSVGFSATGTGLTGLSITDAGSSAFGVDLVKANKHARAVLELTKAELAQKAVTTFPAEKNGVKLSFEGVTDRADDDNTTVGVEDVLATDRVKLVGKVQRTRTKAGKGKPKFTYGAVDLRKVSVTREAPEAEQD